MVGGINIEEDREMGSSRGNGLFHLISVHPLSSIQVFHGYTPEEFQGSSTEGGTDIKWNSPMHGDS